MKKGIWIEHMPAEGPEAVKKMVRNCAEAGFQLLAPAVKQYDGWADYPSEIAFPNPAFRGWDPLAVLVKEAHRLGLQVHAWSCCFSEGKHSKLLFQHPEARSLNRKGKFNVFACPRQQVVQDYLFSIYEEILDRYEVDGIHLDYVRYTDPRYGKESCFCRFCQEKFKKQHKADLLSINMQSPEFGLWVEERCQAISSFVWRVSKLGRKRNVDVSAAVWPEYPWTIIHLGQDWMEWVRKGWLDWLMPMNYTNSNRAFSAFLNVHRLLLKGFSRIKHWEGLMVYPACSFQLFLKQLLLVKKSGIKGAMVFSYAHLLNLKEQGLPFKQITKI